jgi:hypothetical protein
MKRIGIVLVVSLVACTEEAKPPGGVIDLELNEGPPAIGTLVMTNMTFLKDTLAIERLHGSYAIPEGSCIDLQDAPPYQPRTLDVGETVEMINGGTRIVLERMTSTDGSFSYWPSGSQGAQFTVDAKLVPPNTVWDLAFSGSSEVKAQTWNQKLVIPQLFEVREPAGIHTDTGFAFQRGTALPVSWDAFSNISDRHDIIVEIYDKNLVTLAACRTQDTGSFEVPANLIDAVADHAAIMAVRIHIYRNTDLNGAEVEISGGTCDFGPMYLAP